MHNRFVPEWPVGPLAGGGLVPLLQWEEAERSRRSLERRLALAHIGRFKPLADFDWARPTRCDWASV